MSVWAVMMLTMDGRSFLEEVFSSEELAEQYVTIRKEKATRIQYLEGVKWSVNEIHVNDDLNCCLIA